MCEECSLEQQRESDTEGICLSSSFPPTESRSKRACGCLLPYTSSKKFLWKSLTQVFCRELNMQIEVNWVHCAQQDTGPWCLFYKHRSPWEAAANLCGALAAKPAKPWPLWWAALGHAWWCSFGVLLTISILWQTSQPVCTGHSPYRMALGSGVLFPFALLAPVGSCSRGTAMICTLCNRKREGGRVLHGFAGQRLTWAGNTAAFKGFLDLIAKQRYSFLEHKLSPFY